MGQQVGQLAELTAYLDKNNAGANCHKAIKLAQNIIFVLFARAVHIHLRNALNGLLASSKGHFQRLGGESIRIAHHLVREGGGEEENLY